MCASQDQRLAFPAAVALQARRLLRPACPCASFSQTLATPQHTAVTMSACRRAGATGQVVPAFSTMPRARPARWPLHRTNPRCSRGPGGQRGKRWLRHCLGLGGVQRNAWATDHQPTSIKAHQAAISEAIVCACVSRSDTFLVRDGVWLNRACAGDEELHACS